MSTGVIKKVAGPLVIASGMRDANMRDVVRVSEQASDWRDHRDARRRGINSGIRRDIRTWTGRTGRINMEAPMSVELGTWSDHKHL